MPLILKFKPEEQAQVAVWKITEDPEALLEQLRALGVYADIPFFRNQGRLAEWLTARLLLAEMGVSQRITYDKAGKPHLEGAGHRPISLSHSGNYVAAITHHHINVGIDIELTGDRILRVMHKFVGPGEKKWLSDQPDLRLIQLYQIWGAKECAFKIRGGGGIGFMEELEVTNPGSETGTTTQVTLTKDGKSWTYRVFFQYLDKMLLTYGFET